jgi:Raf kinase inhibitor-like YbhB/YbcL family protein
MPLTLISPAFADGQPIPKKYARDGENLFPPLKWTGAPDNVQSFALVVEDPDAPSGIFRHCMIYNVPADRTELQQSIDTAPDTAVRFGRNDFGGKAYDGPEPPVGHGVHHYHFRLAALDVPRLSLPPDAGAAAIWSEARKHMIEEADLVGTYQR